MPDNAGFVADTEPFRRELLAHCYRMLGSIQDAEDLVQETYLRAWRSYGRFEGRSSVRTWLYQIATNGCLTELAKRSRRMLPSGLYAPEQDPTVYPESAGTEVNWLQPAPDAMVTPDSADPAAIVTAREGLRLALIAASTPQELQEHLGLLCAADRVLAVGDEERHAGDAVPRGLLLIGSHRVSVGVRLEDGLYLRRGEAGLGGQAHEGGLVGDRETFGEGGAQQALFHLRLQPAILGQVEQPVGVEGVYRRG